jgi:hypothetical protein
MLVIAVFGGLSLLAGARFAFRPSLRLLSAIAALSLAVLFSVAAGTMADLAAVGTNVPSHPEWQQQTELSTLLLRGCAESMAPGILGFSLLSLTALSCALGLWRFPGRSPHV